MKPKSPRQALSSPLPVDIKHLSFERLARLARKIASTVPWHARFEEIGLFQADVEQALRTWPIPFHESWSHVFDAFVGTWTGGDLKDVSRGYHHIWHPTRIERDQAVQDVLMVCAKTGRKLRAVNTVRRTQDRLEVLSLIGNRAHVGFPLPGGGLAWLGEANDNQLTFHLERVSESGLIYEIRGSVLCVEGSEVWETSPSDWRYHRVADGSVTA